METERKTRALVVDDDDAIRTMLAKIVERLNYRVETARDGVEAMEMLDAGRYDVVVLDLMMPRADGYTVLRHMKERHPGLLACTIVASAVPESEILKRFDAHVFKIHPKPFDIATLMADIRTCAESAA